MTSRPNPFVWTGEEAPQGVFVGGGDEGLSLLGLPQGLRPRQTASEVAEQASPQARARLEDMAAALAEAAAGGPPRRISLEDLSPQDLALVLDVLGSGEVSGLIAAPNPQDPASPIMVQASESVFPGLWLLRQDDAAAPHCAEVGDVPSLAREAAAQVARTSLPLEHMVPPDGTMNVMGVLAEIRHVAQGWKRGDDNHVMNFTLLPMTEPDADFLAAVLAQGPVQFASGGYGSARVIATGLKHVWAVQYLNAMGQVILDTIEIGDVPVAARAEFEDFQDSALRLAHLLKGALQ